MDAYVVYNLVKTLPKEEFKKLYHLMASDIKTQISVRDQRRSKKKSPDISIRDMELYLIKNHFNKK